MFGSIFLNLPRPLYPVAASLQLLFSDLIVDNHSYSDIHDTFNYHGNYCIGDTYNCGRRFIYSCNDHKFIS